MKFRQFRYTCYIAVHTDTHIYRYRYRYMYTTQFETKLNKHDTEYKTNT